MEMPHTERVFEKWVARATRRPERARLSPLKAVLIRCRCAPHSVRRVAGRHRPVACATQNAISKHALRQKSQDPAFFFCSALSTACESVGPAIAQMEAIP